MPWSSFRRKAIGLLSVHLLLFGFFWLGIRALEGDLFALIGLAIVVVDVLLIFGVLRSRSWTRPVILVLAPPLTIYIGWVAVVSAITAPEVRRLAGGGPTVVELLRILVPLLMLLTTAAILFLAGAVRPNAERVPG